MRVLVACESSGIVRDAFARRGHDAMSCDLLPSAAPGPHYQGDVRDVLALGWDLLIAHPVGNLSGHRRRDVRPMGVKKARRARANKQLSEDAAKSAARRAYRNGSVLQRN